MLIKIIFIIFFFVSTYSQELDENHVCYRGVRPRIEKLIELYKNPPSISVAEVIFPDIVSLINKTEDIISNIIDLGDVFNQSKSVQGVLGDEYEKLEQLQNILDLLKFLMKEIDELNRMKNVHDEAFATCSEAKDLYEKLSKDAAAVRKTGNAIKDIIEDITNKVKNVNEKSFQVKKDLDATKVPFSTFDRYVCDSHLQETIQSVLKTIKNNIVLLRQQFNGIIKEKLKRVEKKNNENEKDITEMEESLEERVPNTDIKTTTDTDSNIENLKKYVESLKEKLKNLKLDPASENYLQEVEEKLKNLRNEYELILEQLFSEKNLERVKEELNSANHLLKVIQNRDELEQELKEVKDIVDTLMKGDVCSKTKVDVEDII